MRTCLNSSARRSPEDMTWQPLLPASNISDAAHSARKRRIEVLHICEDARDIADVVDVQISAGIRPYLLTNPTATGSARWWLRAWSDVREWRRLLSGFAVPLVHAHTFTAGMAAVRGEPAVVYELEDFVEHQLAGPGSTWM